MDKQEQFFKANLDYLADKIEGTDEEVALFFAMLDKVGEILDSETFDYLPKELIEGFRELSEGIYEQS